MFHLFRKGDLIVALSNEPNGDVKQILSRFEEVLKNERKRDFYAALEHLAKPFDVGDCGNLSPVNDFLTIMATVKGNLASTTSSGKYQYSITKYITN